MKISPEKIQTCLRMPPRSKNNDYFSDEWMRNQIHLKHLKKGGHQL